MELTSRVHHRLSSCSRTSAIPNMSELVVHEAVRVEDLQQGFLSKIHAIDVGVSLLGLGGLEPVQLVKDIKRQLDAVRRNISELRNAVRQGQQDLRECQDVLQTARALNARLEHMQQHLPAQLPSQQQQLQRPKPNLITVNTVPSRGDHLQQSAVLSSAIKEGSARAVPQFQYITVAEFDDVPKYIRGRLLYEQVNKTVDDLNHAISTKYALLRKPRARLSLPEMALVNALRGQNTPATKGRVFVCSDDLKRWSGVKVDTAARSLLTVLRTAKKLQEIRGPANLIRYAVPCDY